MSLPLESTDTMTNTVNTTTCKTPVYDFHAYILNTFTRGSSEIKIDCCFTGDIDARGLSEFQNLTTLIFLVPGKITALKNLPPTLRILKCPNQCLSSIPSSIENIEMLDLANNQIENLDILQTFKKLTHLNLDNNNFSGTVDQLPDSLTSISFMDNKNKSMTALDISNLFNLADGQVCVPAESDSFHLITRENAAYTCSMSMPMSMPMPMPMAGSGKSAKTDYQGAIKTFQALETKQSKYPAKCSKCGAKDHTIRFWKTKDSKENIHWHAECPRFRAELNMGKTKSVSTAVQELKTQQQSIRHRLALHAENELFEYGSADRIRAAAEGDTQLAAQIQEELTVQGSQLRDLYVFENTNLQKKAYQDMSKLTLELSNAHSRSYDSREEYSNSIAEQVEELMRARKMYTDTLNAPEITRWTAKRKILAEDKDERTAIHSLPAFCMYSTMKPQTTRVVDMGAPPSVISWTETR